MDTTNFQITEIEKAVLGALMIEKKAFPLVAQTLRPEMFYHEKEQTLYAVLENMHRNNEPIDILTVKEALQKRGKLDEAGGAYGIVRLSSKVTSSAHIELHAELIKDRYLRRELIVGINSLTSQSEENECSWTQQLRPMQQLMEETIAEAEQRIENTKNGVTGIPTGLAGLDRLTSGWQACDLNIIAARPSVGKTAIALHLAKAAASAGRHVVFYSIEMQGERLSVRRTGCNHGGETP